MLVLKLGKLGTGRLLLFEFCVCKGSGIGKGDRNWGGGGVLLVRTVNCKLIVIQIISLSFLSQRSALSEEKIAEMVRIKTLFLTNLIYNIK